jgi:hypothetical protein
MTMQRVTLGGSNGLEVLRERPVDGRDAARTQRSNRIVNSPGRNGLKRMKKDTKLLFYLVK